MVSYIHIEMQLEFEKMTRETAKLGGKIKERKAMRR